VGVFMFVGTTAGAIAAFAAGYVYDRFGSYAGAFEAVSVLCFAGFVLQLFLRPPVRQTTSNRLSAVG
jgi:fucose permease